jgi:hypothetical protein
VRNTIIEIFQLPLGLINFLDLSFSRRHLTEHNTLLTVGVCGGSDGVVIVVVIVKHIRTLPQRLHILSFHGS